MSSSGFTGIGYPFRLNSQGGVVTTTTSKNDSSHIDDSIRQILSTHELERPMETEIYSNIDQVLFEPNDEGVQAILRSIIVEDLDRLEDRISVSEEDIDFVVEEENGIDYLYVIITYTVLKYNADFTSQFKLGEVQS